MKALLVIAILITSSLFVKNSQAQGTAQLKFEQMDHNFGVIKEEGGPANFNFQFTNTGNVPLIIQHVEASCGCTTPEWSKEPILPGKGGFINVSYNPEQRPGVFNKSITVTSNAAKGIIVLTISGEVTPKTLLTNDLYPIDFGAARLSADELSFVRIKDHEVSSDTLKVFNPGTSPLTINFKIIPPHLNLKTIPSTIAPKGKGVIIVTFNAAKKQEYGFMTNRIYLGFNQKEQYKDAIKVSATIEEDFSKLSDEEIANAPRIELNCKIFDFKELAEGESASYTFILSNKGKKPLIIRSITASCGCTTAKPSSNVLAPGSTTDLKVTFDSQGKLGIQNKVLTVITNDPEHSTTLLHVIGTVKSKP
ncbi:MAG: DUF1573 domain-containing protein [Bacteroidia bacterium]|nr:DUF1573 domain-containing protein [Bacteroidia bacterium]